MFGIDDAALATLIAAGVSTAGSLYANSKNRKNQNSINQQNMAIAAMNNATQIDMANSAHQREVADLRKAGLNPILSAGGSGSATPTLAAPQLGTAHVENPVQHATASAGQLSRIVSANARADVAQKVATTENLAAQNKNLDVQNTLLNAQVDKTRAETDAIRHPVTRGARDVLGTVDEAMRRSVSSSDVKEPIKAAMRKELEMSHSVPANTPSSASSFGHGKTVYDQLLEKEKSRLRSDGLMLHMSNSPDKPRSRHSSIYSR